MLKKLWCKVCALTDGSRVNSGKVSRRRPAKFRPPPANHAGPPITVPNMAPVHAGTSASGGATAGLGPAEVASETVERPRQKGKGKEEERRGEAAGRRRGSRYLL